MKKHGLIAEFKEFVMRGNVVDMAVGVIVGASFGKITTSLVNDVFMPLIGWLIGDMDLTALNITPVSYTHLASLYPEVRERTNLQIRIKK